MAKLSISRAWDESRAVTGRAGGLLMAVALALLVLPGVISDLVTPVAPAGEIPEPGAWMIVALIAILVAVVGQLAITRLALGSLQTVGEAIAEGARRTPAYVGATLLWAGPVVLLMLLVAPLVVPPNPQPAASLFFLLLFLLLLFLFIRLVVAAPVAAAERLGPVGILKRSWKLTAGNWWRLFGFAVLFLVAVLILIAAVGAVIGVIVGLLIGTPEPMTVGALLISLATQLVAAAVTVLFLVMLARIYLQLSAEPAETSVPPSSGT